MYHVTRHKYMYHSWFVVNVISLWRWMYWTDYSANTIEKASMDGSSRTVLHSSSLSTPRGITMDYQAQTLYWVDSSLDKIERSNTDGSNRVVLTSSNVQNPWGISVYSGNIYWSDTSLLRILSAPLSSPTSYSYITSSLGYTPYGIEVFAKERQPTGAQSSILFCLKSEKE